MVYYPLQNCGVSTLLSAYAVGFLVHVVPFQEHVLLPAHSRVGGGGGGGLGHSPSVLLPAHSRVGGLGRPWLSYRDFIPHAFSRLSVSLSVSLFEHQNHTAMQL